MVALDETKRVIRDRLDDALLSSDTDSALAAAQARIRALEQYDTPEWRALVDGISELATTYGAWSDADLVSLRDSRASWAANPQLAPLSIITGIVMRARACGLGRV